MVKNKMTAQELSDAIAEGLDFETVLKLMRPLIAKTSHQHHIVGQDIEDVEQELALVLYKCWKGYDRKKALFTTLVKQAFFNEFWKINFRSNNRLPVVFLVCVTEGCEGKLMSSRARGGVCVLCGKSRWKAIRSERMLSSIYAHSNEDDDDFEIGIPDKDEYEASSSGMDIDRALVGADVATKQAVKLALGGVKLNAEDRRRVATFVTTLS